METQQFRLQMAGLDLGADGFMIKAHFTPSEVVKEINKILNGDQNIKINEEYE